MIAGSLPPSSIEALSIFSGQTKAAIRAIANDPTVSPIEEHTDDPTELQRNFPTPCPKPPTTGDLDLDQTRWSFLLAFNNVVNKTLGHESRTTGCDIRVSEELSSSWSRNG
ncbi:MAG TPA: hypothetical protein VGZ00_07600 [Candidatus Baltobacteraceae bacterium]|jgi:hypothetical protein|nr:hypothetical protein [Candidatus Baltobacteraceae bacterium]